jgi:glyoxylase-like metal-dependent hydrolase (beta-lactamase superfamily II)
MAHRLTLQRQRREGSRTLAAMSKRDPVSYAGVVLRPATMTFDGQLDLDLGGMRVELRHLPGHTPDCIVAYIPERRLLFAGDTAEDPIPLLNKDPLTDWPDRLLEWTKPAKVVVPAHGAISGPDLLERNAAYLRDLIRDPTRPVPELDGAPSFYRDAHRLNLRRAQPR